ncbi:MAG: hypothetical protein FJ144_14915 [Deltaproteobacteria bacterium]|nr:hypothetical protein [Deltaproteobacteria bacterium]
MSAPLLSADSHVAPLPSFWREYLQSLSFVARTFAGVPADETRKIAYENARAGSTGSEPGQVSAAVPGVPGVPGVP